MICMRRRRSRSKRCCGTSGCRTGYGSRLRPRQHRQRAARRRSRGDRQRPRRLRRPDALLPPRLPDGAQGAGWLRRHRDEPAVQVGRGIRRPRARSVSAGDRCCCGSPSWRASAALAILEGRGLARIHAFRKRLPDDAPRRLGGPQGQLGMAFAWFVWDRSHMGPTTIDRISWERP